MLFLKKIAFGLWVALAVSPEAIAQLRLSQRDVGRYVLIGLEQNAPRVPGGPIIDLPDSGYIAEVGDGYFVIEVDQDSYEVADPGRRARFRISTTTDGFYVDVVGDGVNQKGVLFDDIYLSDPAMSSDMLRLEQLLELIRLADELEDPKEKAAKRADLLVQIKNLLDIWVKYPIQVDWQYGPAPSDSESNPNLDGEPTEKEDRDRNQEVARREQARHLIAKRVKDLGTDVYTKLTEPGFVEGIAQSLPLSESWTAERSMELVKYEILNFPYWGFFGGYSSELPSTSVSNLSEGGRPRKIYIEVNGVQTVLTEEYVKVLPPEALLYILRNELGLSTDEPGWNNLLENPRIFFETIRRTTLVFLMRQARMSPMQLWPGGSSRSYASTTVPGSPRTQAVHGAPVADQQDFEQRKAKMYSLYDQIETLEERMKSDPQNAAKHAERVRALRMEYARMRIVFEANRYRFER